MSDYKDWTDRELPSSVMDTLEVDDLAVNYEIVCADLKMTDRPMFFAGRTAGNIDTDIIIDFNDVQVDTHNAYSGGAWVCPKDGVYSIISNIFMYISSSDYSTFAIMYINNDIVQITYQRDTDVSGDRHSVIVSSRELKKNDLVFIKSYAVNGDEYISGTDSARTNLSISYLGA